MTFSKEIIEILEYIGQKFGIAIDWSNENVMPYIKQLCERYISWEIATSFAWLIAMILIMAILITLLVFSIKHKQEEAAFFISILILFSGIICIPVIGKQIYDIITCKTFPELKIIEFIKRIRNTFEVHNKCRIRYINVINNEEL